jgi:hypothetical protein
VTLLTQARQPPLGELFGDEDPGHGPMVAHRLCVPRIYSGSGSSSSTHGR